MLIYYIWTPIALFLKLLEKPLIMLENKEEFDLSNFPKDHKLFCADNKKVPRKIKDERPAIDIFEFFGLKPKSYVITDSNSKKCIHKGHSADFNSNEYRDVLSNSSILRHTMKKITTLNHKIYTGIINKGSLSCFDDKVYLKDDGIDTLLHGHKDIPKNKKMKESK